MATQVSRALASTAPLNVLDQARSCRHDKIQRVVQRVRNQFPECVALTETLIGRKLNLELKSFPFTVVWDIEKQMVCMDLGYFDTKKDEDLVQDIVFEMHNAQYSPVFRGYFDAIPKLDVETFVRKIEWTEWRTTSRTLRLLREKGIPEADIMFCYTYYEHSELYYLQQQLEGHSQTIARRYCDQGGSREVPYLGTWLFPFELKSTEHLLLRELVADHLAFLRRGEEGFMEKLEVLETDPPGHLEPSICQKVAENFRWFLKKYQSLSAESQS